MTLRFAAFVGILAFFVLWKLSKRLAPPLLDGVRIAGTITGAVLAITIALWRPWIYSTWPCTIVAGLVMAAFCSWLIERFFSTLVGAAINTEPSVERIEAGMTTEMKAWSKESGVRSHLRGRQFSLNFTLWSIILFVWALIFSALFFLVRAIPIHV